MQEDCTPPPHGAFANGNGYYRIAINGQRRYAHRVAYESVHGPVSRSLVIDHLCRNRWCCNPDHLEAVTQRENILRGSGASARNAVKTHCPNGHEYVTRPNGKRRCDICDRDRAIARGERGGGTYTGDRTHCPRGHEYTEENTIYSRQGDGKWSSRSCRLCARIRQREYKIRKRDLS